MINRHFLNQVKTNDIGRAKDLAVDLQRRANELATSASNKMANIYGKHDWMNPMHCIHESRFHPGTCSSNQMWRRNTRRRSVV